jgi:hypothetical protein
LKADFCITSFQRAIGACIILCASTSAMYAQQDDPCGTQAERQQKETSLRETVSVILHAIQSKNSPLVLKHVDKQGIATWGDELSVSEIKREFQQKSGFYCLLFSTACIASTEYAGRAYINTEKWKISYSEWLAKNISPKIEIEMFYGGEDQPCHANVAIRTREKSPTMEETFELGFAYRANNSWMLVSTPAWPEGIAGRMNGYWNDQEHIEVSYGN